MIWKPLDFAQIRSITGKNDAIDRDEPTSLLNETKAKQEEDSAVLGRYLVLFMFKFFIYTIQAVPDFLRKYCDYHITN